MNEPANAEPWYSVRCLFRHTGEASMYEERVTIWRADSFDDAIEMAEREANEYAQELDATYLGLAQSFHLAVEDRALADGDEVFSLLRASDRSPADYIAAFFDTGEERQRAVE